MNKTTMANKLGAMLILGMMTMSVPTTAEPTKECDLYSVQGIASCLGVLAVEECADAKTVPGGGAWVYNRTPIGRDPVQPQAFYPFSSVGEVFESKDADGNCFTIGHTCDIEVQGAGEFKTATMYNADGSIVASAASGDWHGIGLTRVSASCGYDEASGTGYIAGQPALEVTGAGGPLSAGD